MSIRRYTMALLLGAAVVSAHASVHKTTHHSVSQNSQISHPKQLININKSDARALESIKGIGPKKAQAIVNYRTQNGPFKSVNDLTKVKGIGSKKLAKIAQRVTV